jgi:hypothetical protein
MSHVAWAKRGEARFLAIDGDVVRLESTASSPPGSRADGKLADGTAVRVKVHRCRALEGRGFEIEGRLIDASRALRDAIARLAGGA